MLCVSLLCMHSPYAHKLRSKQSETVVSCFTLFGPELLAVCSYDTFVLISICCCDEGKVFHAE